MNTLLNLLPRLNRAVLLLFAWALLASQAADSYFLKIDGIQGESTHDQHKDEIEIESFSWAVSRSGELASGGVMPDGRPTFEDFAITARLSKASPVLALRCADGRIIRNAILTVRQRGGSKEVYYKIQMENLQVSRVQNVALPGSDRVEDTVMFRFSKISWTYRETKQDGSLGPPTTTSWDLVTGKGT